MKIKQIIITMLLIVMTGCSSTPPTPPPPYDPLTGISTGIVFAGKVVNSDGDWPNDRLMILYLNDTEISRTISKRTAFPEAQHAITDGTFIFYTENPYQLSIKALTEQGLTFGAGNWQGTNFIFKWIGDTEEGGYQTIFIPSKNAYYTIKVFAGSQDKLPQEIKAAGSTQISNYKSKGTPTITLKHKPEETQTSPSEPVNIVKRYNTQLETKDGLPTTISLNNCGGSTPIQQKYTDTQTFVHKYTTEVEGKLGVEIPVASWLAIVAELNAKYGFEQGEIMSKTLEYVLAANEKSNQVYTIRWSEIWEKSQVDVSVQGNLFQIPYKVEKDLVYEITSVSFVQIEGKTEKKQKT